MGSVRTLGIWRDSVVLVKGIYELSRDWPKAEMFGLTAQIRRAAVSVPTNLAEGVGRGSAAEMCKFGRIALGSLYEVDTLLELARELGLSNAAVVDALNPGVLSLIRRTSAFVRFQHSRRVSKHEAPTTNHTPQTTHR